ncbi:carbonic anhydrase [Sediminihabitans luteus]|uniref:carbonic anhydrase n=1 Tax=Sediminihabitans luteus TaxID=1138585 RepID=A0A2M9CZ78_9CELL|nr:carbonic anhydrase [Sediminihabitans luteus]PJJ77038.1 carbonic anhydrase [Sediminihabitans luteus]GII99680.1 carbonic anhydrase [Sediminihabitans luteus]
MTDATEVQTTPSAPPTPREAWERLRHGNQRFVEGTVQHPSQDAGRRAELTVAQHPFAVVFGCSDSRVAAEIIFDQGLGDAFVVRTAGHVIDTTVLGSIEYGVDILGASLVVVLGHDSCGAVAAAAHTLETGEQAGGFVRAVVDRVIPSIVNITASGRNVRGEDGEVDPDLLRREHVRHTVSMLHSYSAGLASAVAEGRCAVVGVEYSLTEGQARLVEVLGDVGEDPIA